MEKLCLKIGFSNTENNGKLSHNFVTHNFIPITTS